MSGMDRLTDENLEYWANFGSAAPQSMARELLAHRRASQAAPAHEDDLAVDRFAAVMKAKLAKKRNDGRGGWSGPECSEETLSRMLRDHVGKGDPVDVANFAMMLHQRGDRIAQAAPAPSDHAISKEWAERMLPLDEGVTPSAGSPAPSDGLREAAATILAVLEDPDSLPYEHHPDWQAIYNAMTEDHSQSMEICGTHDWPSLLTAAMEVMAEPRAAPTEGEA